LKSTLLSTFILFYIIFLSSCASEYAYDNENPEAYKKHWKNNNEVKDNTFLYQLSEECKVNNKKSNNCF